MESNLIVPDRDDRGKPFRLTDEQFLHILWTYRLRPEATPAMRSRAFTYYGAMLVRPQKHGKDPLAAARVCAEALGPVVFDGWDAAGEPVGRQQSTPIIQCVANSEEQAPVTFDPIYTMLTEGPLAGHPGLDAGLTRITLPGGGSIKAVAASAKSRLGARLTFATFTEALALDTRIPTPTGWTTMGELQPGDEIFGARGQTVRVNRATDVQLDRTCYRVKFRDGTDLVASDGHLWQTRVNSSAALPQVRTTQQMVDDGRTFMVPTTRPVEELQHAELDIDPYILGLWLGDGDARNATITVGDQDLVETTRLIEAQGYTTKLCSTGDRAKLLYVSLPGSIRCRWSPVRGLKPRLRDLDLLANKHIPAQYMRASHDQRLALLQGLMDSDGCAAKAGNCFFAQTDKGLTDQVEELLRSLGQVASTCWESDSRSRNGGQYRVNFTPRWGLIPFRLPRKAARVRGCRRSEQWLTIESITEVPSAPVRCIAVSASDHLFLAGDGWHVTHNTHLFVQPANGAGGGGIEVADAMKRNLAGMGGRWMEVTNAWDPTERSTAQRTFEAKAPGVFLDYRPPRTKVDIWDDAALLEELTYVYGDSTIERGGWVDILRIKEEIQNPARSEGNSRRFFLNEVTVGSRDAVDMLKWVTQKRTGQLEAGDRITLGFHGALTKDATSLCASRLSDGRLFHLRTWERPYGYEGDWSTPRAQLHQAVRDAFAGFDVLAMMCSPHGWQTEVDTWAGEFDAEGEAKVLEIWLNSEMRMDQLVERFMTAHRGDELTHDGDETLSLHAAGAALAAGKKRPAAEEREPGQSEHYQRIVRKSPAQSISAFTAALLAYEARGWAIEHGALAESDMVPNLW